MLNATLVHVVIFKNLNLFFLNVRLGLSVFMARRGNWDFETFGNHLFLQMLPGNLVTFFQRGGDRVTTFNFALLLPEAGLNRKVVPGLLDR